MKNFSSTLVKNFFANPKVRVFCMAYARNADKIIFASLSVAVVAVIGFVILTRNSNAELYVLHFRGIMVGLFSILPMIPAIIVNDMKERYKLISA